MDEIAVDSFADPALESPVLIEGLPGVGHVGTLAVEHLIEEFDATLLRRVYSEHFPPQVRIEDTTTSLTCSEVYSMSLGAHDILLLTGDHQPQTPEGQYRLTATYLEIAEEFGVEEIFALGGVPTGELIDEYAVLGAATSEDVVERLADAPVEFREDEPAGGIVGVSGLLLGLGKRNGFDGVCLMGETSGYLVDPKSAKQLLEVLGDILDFEVDMRTLDDRADEMEDVIRKIQELESQAQMDVPTDEDLRYIG